MKPTIEIAAFAVAVLVAALAAHAWLVSRDDQRRLQATLDAQQKIVSDAVVREGSRDSSLASALSQIAKLKASAQTPQEIVRDLPKYLALPQPIALADEPSTPPLSAPKDSNPQIPRTQDYAGAAQAQSRKGTGAPNSPDSTEPPYSKISSDKPSDGSSPSENSGIGALLSSTSSTPNPTSTAKAEIPAADLKPLYDYVQDCRATQAQLTVAQQNATDDATRIAAISRERDAAVTASKGGNFWKRLRRNAEWFAIGAAAGALAASTVHSSR